MTRTEVHRINCNDCCELEDKAGHEMLCSEGLRVQDAERILDKLSSLQDAACGVLVGLLLIFGLLAGIAWRLR